MKSEFLNHFYSMCRIVSITKLTNTRQWNNKLVIDYINSWCALSLKCKDYLSESLVVEMCAQGTDWDILYSLRVNKPKTF